MRFAANKFILIAAQLSPILLVVEYVFFRTVYLFPISAIFIGILIFTKCSNCGTLFEDPRIYSKLKVLMFWNTDIIDNCPVCGMKMNSSLSRIEKT